MIKGPGVKKPAEAPKPTTPSGEGATPDNCPRCGERFNHMVKILIDVNFEAECPKCGAMVTKEGKIRAVSALDQSKKSFQGRARDQLFATTIDDAMVRAEAERKAEELNKEAAEALAKKGKGPLVEQETLAEDYGDFQAPPPPPGSGAGGYDQGMYQQGGYQQGGYQQGGYQQGGYQQNPWEQPAQPSGGQSPVPDFSEESDEGLSPTEKILRQQAMRKKPSSGAVSKDGIPPPPPMEQGSANVGQGVGKFGRGMPEIKSKRTGLGAASGGAMNAPGSYPTGFTMTGPPMGGRPMGGRPMGGPQMGGPQMGGLQMGGPPRNAGPRLTAEQISAGINSPVLDERKRAVRASSNLGTGALPHLARALDDKAVEVRMTAAEVLGDLPVSTDVLDLIEKAIDDKEFQVSKSALKSISRMASSQEHGAKIVSILKSNINHKYDEISEKSYGVLSTILGPDIDLIRKGLSSKSWLVRKAAVNGLKQLGPAHADVPALLKKASKDKNPDVAAAAENALQGR